MAICNVSTDIACKRTGKGTGVWIQEICDETQALTDNFDCGSAADAWLELGCVFNVQPPSCVFDTVTGEQCLSEGANPTSELGDIQADNPAITISFCPGTVEYDLLRDGVICAKCYFVRYEYPGGAKAYFFAYIQSLEPSEISRNDFSQSTVTFLRTSQVYRDCTAGTGSPCADPIGSDLLFSNVLVVSDPDPENVNFDCASCRPL